MNKKWMVSAALLPVFAGMFFFVSHSAAQGPDQQAETKNVVHGRVVPGDQDKPVTSPVKTIDFPGTNGGKVQLPFQMIEAELSLDERTRAVNSQPSSPPVMSYKIPPKKKDMLQAVMVYRSDMAGGYMLLAPAGWQASATVGANGSFGVTFSDPNNKEQTLNYSDTAGSCQGCAITNIGSYFPDQAKWADEQGFTADLLSFKEWSQAGKSGQDARTASYRTEPEEGYDNKGAVYYQRDSAGYLFRKLEFKLSNKNRTPGDPFDTILDFFKTYHGALVMEENNSPKILQALQKEMDQYMKNKRTDKIEVSIMLRHDLNISKEQFIKTEFSSYQDSITNEKGFGGYSFFAKLTPDEIIEISQWNSVSSLSVPDDVVSVW
ncbi:DUF4850 domain-containing protein [Paenibacillus faecalis]|uniref:DUF4850 domain-containing protein n=1 Tax=Paenibacillus faecalis TaxID=2079532 RepID=UPI00131A564B|nr:DUF4850 domain-containing protein [Paenibacillus faecalis]